MTPKQILDSFSETLMQDDRILNARERELLANLLQHAKADNGEDPKIDPSVRNVIASAVGETVAQRAFSVLGGSIVERLLAGGNDSSGNQEREISQGRLAKTLTPGVPVPPGPEPPAVKAPKKPVRDTPVVPPAPSPGPEPPTSPGPKRAPFVPTPPPGPEPPTGRVDATVTARSQVAVVERPDLLPARCVVLDEFLAPQEVAELTAYVLARQPEFQASEVVSPSSEKGIVNYEHRRSRVLMNVGPHEHVILQRIKTVLPDVLHTLGMEQFLIADSEVQVTASNDGDYFHFHSDNSDERVASRYLTFVYFFHREPKQFEGGELRIHDARLDGSVYVSQGSYQAIAPRQNQIVFFPCELLHEITPIECASQQFADSRFTLNGWLRR